jgi:hypothetical protein
LHQDDILCSDVENYHDGDSSGPYFCHDYKSYKWCENCKEGSGWDELWGSLMRSTLKKCELSCGCCSKLTFSKANVFYSVRNYSDTLKIPAFKIKTRNEILSFFPFCSVFKIRKMFFDIIILLTNVYLKVAKNNFRNQNQKIYKEIVDKKSILVAYVG